MSKATRGRPKKDKDEVLRTCSLRLRPELLEEIQEIAEKTDRSVAQTMRRIIETFLPDYKHRENIGDDEDDKDPSDYILTTPRNKIEVSSA